MLLRNAFRLAFYYSAYSGSTYTGMVSWMGVATDGTKYAPNYGGGLFVGASQGYDATKWQNMSGIRLLLNTTDTAPTPEQGTLDGLVDIVPDSPYCEASYRGHLTDTTSGSPRPRIICRQTYSNATDAPITVKQLALASNYSWQKKKVSEQQYDSVLLAVQPLEEPITIGVGEQKTFTMTIFLTD